MPRVFYKVIVGIGFALAGIALLAAQLALVFWLTGRYPNKLTWLTYVVIGFADIPVFDALLNAAIKRVREA